MEPPEVAQLKGSILAGYATSLRARGLFDAVRAELGPETAALMDTPPLAISWVETRHARDVLDAVERLRGLDEVRKLGAESMSHGVFRLIQPMLAGLMRVAGGAPHALFRKLDSAMKVAARGYALRYREVSEGAGDLELRTMGLADSRAGLVGGWENAFGTILELADVRGTVRLHGFERHGADTVSHFHARWEPRRT